VILACELTEAEIELIASAEVPPEYAYLDAELEGWEPKQPSPALQS
jgi:hypothetical protein